MSLRRDMSASADSTFFLTGPGHNAVHTDFEDLQNVALADMQKKGTNQLTGSLFQYLEGEPVLCVAFASMGLRTEACISDAALQLASKLEVRLLARHG